MDYDEEDGGSDTMPEAEEEMHPDWERHLAEGIPLRGSNEGKLLLPYKWFEMDHTEARGKVKKVHLELQLLSGTSSGAYSVSIGGRKRNKLIIVDQKGLSKEIFWRSERLARDLYFLRRDDATDVIKGFKDFHSNLTANGTRTIAQTMEIEFPFPLRTVETPHAPYDEEFFPDEESENHGAASILTGVNLDIIVDWNDVSRPQTGKMRRNRAKPRTSFSATHPDEEFSVPSHQRYSVSSDRDYDEVYSQAPESSCPAADRSFGAGSYCEEHEETSHASESFAVGEIMGTMMAILSCLR